MGISKYFLVILTINLLFDNLFVLILNFLNFIQNYLEFLYSKLLINEMYQTIHNHS